MYKRTIGLTRERATRTRLMRLARAVGARVPCERATVQPTVQSATTVGAVTPGGSTPTWAMYYITVFQNQVPNSKGRAVIHSEELPPESQANYRPSHRPITARVTDQLPPARRGPLWSAGVAGYNPGPGRLKLELPSASPTASAVSALPRDACAGSAPWLPA